MDPMDLLVSLALDCKCNSLRLPFMKLISVSDQRYLEMEAYLNGHNGVNALQVVTKTGSF